MSKTTLFKAGDWLINLDNVTFIIPKEYENTFALKIFFMGGQLVTLERDTKEETKKLLEDILKCWGI